MHIRIISGQRNDATSYQKMLINGEDALHIQDLWECPEDAIIGRDLTTCFDILELMEKAYEAGKNGEEFIVKTIDKTK